MKYKRSYNNNNNNYWKLHRNKNMYTHINYPAVEIASDSIRSCIAIHTI